MSLRWRDAWRNVKGLDPAIVAARQASPVRFALACTCELHRRDLVREHPGGCPTFDIPSEGYRTSATITNLANISTYGSPSALCAELGSTLK